MCLYTKYILNRKYTYTKKNQGNVPNWLYNERSYVGGNNVGAKIYTTDPGTDPEEKNKLVS